MQLFRLGSSLPVKNRFAAPVRHLRSASDPPIAMVIYPFQGGAPVKTAINTNAGPLKIASSLQKKSEEVCGVSMLPFSFKEGTRDNKIHGMTGIRNYYEVCRAVQHQFSKNVFAILSGKKPLGIGGDHSMAAGTIPGVVLGVTVRELLRANDDPLKDPHLTLIGRKEEQDRAISRLRLARENVLAGSGDDQLVRKLGAVVEDMIYSDMLPLSQYMIFKNRFYVIWFDAHYDINSPYDGKQANVAFGETLESDALGRFAVIQSPSPSGNFHGMPVASVSGSGEFGMMKFACRYLSINPSNLRFIAVRDADPNEEKIADELNIPNYDMEKIAGEGGVRGVVEKIFSLAERESEARCLMPPFIIGELDVDGMDAIHVPLTGTPVGTGSNRNPNQGPSLEESVLGFRGFLQHPAVEACDVAEIAYNETEEGIVTLESSKALINAVVGFDDAQLNLFWHCA